MIQGKEKNGRRILVVRCAGEDVTVQVEASERKDRSGNAARNYSRDLIHGGAF